MNAHEVQKLEGHGNLQTTMSYCAMVDEDALERAREASERICQTASAG